MSRSWSTAALIVAALVVSPALGQEPPKLEAKRVNVKPGWLTLESVLGDIERQTGNRVLDRRSTPGGAVVGVAIANQPFWSALDIVSKTVDARINLYGDGGVAFVDGPRRDGVFVVSEVCRVELRKLAVVRDFETGGNSAHAELEIAWEPSFEPLYMDVDHVRGRFALDAAGKSLAFGPIRGVNQSVAQRRAQVVDLRLPGPDRSSPKLASLAGDIKFIGSPRMIAATFKNLSPKVKDVTYTEDGVTVVLRSVVVKSGFWTFDLTIANPDGGPAFESFQSWLDNNRIHLERIESGKKEIWTPDPNDWQAEVVGRGARVRYRFQAGADRGQPSDWTLVYRTPGRMGVFSIPFQFKDVTLP
jgi:hypothetical protein